MRTDNDSCNVLTMAGTMIMSAASRVFAEAIGRRAGQPVSFGFPLPSRTARQWG